MGSAYLIAGKEIPAHYLSLATLGAVVFFTIPKPWGPKKALHPSINASSPEEEKFVTEWLAKNGLEKH